MKKDNIEINNEFELFNEEPKFEFPKEIFSLSKESEDLLSDNKNIKDKHMDFESLLAELNKQVSNADSTVNSLVVQKEELNQKSLKLSDEEKKLANEKFSFEQEMKSERQKLNDEKIDFEQEKTKIYADIDSKREELNKNKNEFEKYRIEQINLIEKNKKDLEDNYSKFQEIVKKFISKINNKE
ncbi:MAG: hypothetical protein PUD07_01690 [bacterium]|nr:hypothetical protein [bacterium]